ncbi:MAG: DUF1292 domain-containing protein [Oscillospiraceae bacterium]|nr:DUF1292 domain-containing protein [Oscillospiraceae bacterium]
MRNDMNEYGSDYLNLVDEDGNEYELERLFDFEFEGEEYAVFVPAGELAEKDQDMILFHVVYEDHEEQFEDIDESVYDRVYEHFIDTLFEA